VTVGSIDTRMMGETVEARHLTMDELLAGLDAVRRSPRGTGRLELVVRRPDVDRREVLAEGMLDRELGLVGDSWTRRGSKRTADGSPHPDMQLNVINAAFAQLVAGSPDRWALAGDQLYVDLDLSEEALPAGTRLAIGAAVIEVTDQPHNGCAKFAARFGRDAHKIVWTDQGKAMRLRGLNAKVVTGGAVRPGDPIRVLGGVGRQAGSSGRPADRSAG
jgi:hypothetical protein